MDWTESTLSNRRDFRQEIAIFGSLEFSGDKLKQISIYDKMTRSEKEVAELLKNLGIKWSYEHPVFVWDENKRPRVWAPDFYLIPFGVYVEVCGSESFNYDYRRKVFDSNGYRVIFLHLYKESNRWKNHLMSYLQFFINYRTHKLSEIIRNKN